MQIYEIFRKKQVSEAAVATAPAPVAKPAGRPRDARGRYIGRGNQVFGSMAQQLGNYAPASPVNAVPNPLAQQMPTGMVTTPNWTQPGTAPAADPNAAYSNVTYNVPTGVTTPQVAPAPQAGTASAAPSDGRDISVGKGPTAASMKGKGGSKEYQDAQAQLKQQQQPAAPKTSRDISVGKGPTAAAMKGKGGSKEYQDAQAQLKQQQQPVQQKQPVQQQQPTTTPAAQKQAAKAPAKPSNLGSIAKALGSAAVAAAGKYVQNKTGIDTSRAGSGTPYGAKQSAAAAAAGPVITAQAQQQAALWKQGLTQAMQQAGVSDPSKLPQQSRTEMLRSLDNQLHKNLLQNRLGSNYRSLPRYVSPAYQQQSADAVQRLNQARKSISSFNGPLNDQQNLANWQALCQAAYDAMALTQFNPATGFGQNKKQQAGAQGAQQAGAQQAGGQQSIQQQAETTLAQSGVPATTLNKIQAVTGQLPAVSSQDPQVQAYLAALGFKP